MKKETRRPQTLEDRLRAMPPHEAINFLLAELAAANARLDSLEKEKDELIIELGDALQRISD